MNQLTITPEEKRWFEGRPLLPIDRPPTLAQVREYAIYHHSELKTEEAIEKWVGEYFVSNYVHYVNVYGWDHPPDWREGDPVVAAACPTQPFSLNKYDRRNRDEVARLYKLQKGG